MVVVKDVPVEYPQAMAADEATKYAEEEIGLWAGMNKQLGLVVIEIDGTEVIVRSSERSPIRRVRRITGYLSEVGNFNDAKRAELKERSAHACSAR